MKYNIFDFQIMTKQVTTSCGSLNFAELGFKLQLEFSILSCLRLKNYSSFQCKNLYYQVTALILFVSLLCIICTVKGKQESNEKSSLDQVLYCNQSLRNLTKSGNKEDLVWFEKRTKPWTALFVSTLFGGSPVLQILGKPLWKI